jgi:anti-anti-sigma factor
VKPQPDLCEVRLLRLPVNVQRVAAEHHDALMRELSLIKASTAAESLPQQLVAVTNELHEKFGRFAVEPRSALESAYRQGDDYIDVTYYVPREAADAATRLSALLGAADDYCRAGEHLVTLATPPVAVAYRRWLLDEFVGQLAGRPPRPWTMPLELLMQSEEWPTDVDGETAAITLNGELDLATAPQLRDHLTQLYASGVRNFVLDSNRVSFIDSVGLSVILALFRRCREEEGSLTIKSPSRVMQRTLEVAGLFDVLDISA